MHWECFPTLANALRIAKNLCQLLQIGLRIISNKGCNCLANFMNVCECLQMGLQTLQAYLWMMWMSCQRCHYLAIFLRIYDDEAVIIMNTEWIWSWAHCFLELKSLATVVKYSQGMGNGECYKHLANALRTLQMLPNAIPTVPMACECLRKLTIPKLVNIRKQVENDKFVTNV